MNPQSKYTLYYSNNCIHSKEFISQLYKNQSIYKKFNKIDVQNTIEEIPQYVKAVPTIVIKPVNATPQIYTGDEVFKWYNQLVSRLISRLKKSDTASIPTSNMGNGTAKSLGNIADYDPCTMSGFSDGFAYLEDKAVQSNPIEHRFEFLGRGNSLHPVENMKQMQTQVGGKKSDEDKNGLAGAYEQLMAQRSLDVPPPPERKAGTDM